MEYLALALHCQHHQNKLVWHCFDKMKLPTKDCHLITIKNNLKAAITVDNSQILQYSHFFACTLKSRHCYSRGDPQLVIKKSPTMWLALFLLANILHKLRLRAIDSLTVLDKHTRCEKQPCSVTKAARCSPTWEKMVCHEHTVLGRMECVGLSHCQWRFDLKR